MNSAPIHTVWRTDSPSETRTDFLWGGGGVLIVSKQGYDTRCSLDALFFWSQSRVYFYRSPGAEAEHNC